MEAEYAGARIDVVEIDPEVTRVVHEYLGLPRSTTIRSYNEDGRWFVMNSKDKGRYDFIFGDAFNDLSIPYHLTTREFSSLLRSLLKPEGLLIANVIDHFKTGLFMPSYVRTLEEVFGRGKIALVSDSSFEDMGISTMIVAASPGSHAWKDAEKLNPGNCYVIDPGEVDQKLKNRFAVILTDDYAPVDNLTAPIFEERFGKKRRG
jgi:spermidine synthase